MATTTKTRAPKDEKAAPARRSGQRRTPAEKVAEAKADRPPCLCGCGGFPRSAKGRYLPGHDARHYAAIKRENGTIA